MRRRAALAALLASAVAGGAGIAQAPGGDAYVFAYFIGNGEDGLYLAGSRDGYRWDALNGGRSVLAPTVGKAKLMRDPCILRGPDGRLRDIRETAEWRRDNLPLWSDSAASVHAYEGKHDAEPSPSRYL